MSRPYPWAGHVHPIDDSDFRYKRELESIESKDGVDRAVSRILGRGIFYRVGAPVLGEPLKRMSCSRGTGHFGTGLYFFGTLRAAMKYGPIDSIYRVSHGPSNPMYLTKRNVHSLHEFARATLCAPQAFIEYTEISHRVQELESRQAEILSLEDDDPSDELDEITTQIRSLSYQQTKARSDLFSHVLKLRFDGPKMYLGGDGVDNQVRIPDTVHQAIEASSREGIYHPMTYLMRWAGYDGILYTDMGELEGGDRGCIWYPDVG